MLYRPNFCCSCGERIERIDWKLWISRRFCDLCATEHTLGEIGSKAVVIIGFVIGIFGIGGYLQSRPASGSPVAKRTFLEQPDRKTPASDNNKQATNTGVSQSQPSSPVPAVADTTQKEEKNLQRSPEPARATNEPVYYCGAATKKGTPCSRRVKSPNTRCWQHVGMPAMKQNTGASG